MTELIFTLNPTLENHGEVLKILEISNIFKKKEKNYDGNIFSPNPFSKKKIEIFLT